MAASLGPNLAFLSEVTDRFRFDKTKHGEFLKIFLDFVNKSEEGDETLRRAYELFDGEVRMRMGFYKLLLEQKRKKIHCDFAPFFGVFYSTMNESDNYPVWKVFLQIMDMQMKDKKSTPIAFKEVAESLLFQHPDLLKASDTTLNHPALTQIQLLYTKLVPVIPRQVYKLGKKRVAHDDDTDLDGACVARKNNEKRRCIEHPKEDSCRKEHEENIEHAGNDKKLDDVLIHPERVGEKASSMFKTKKLPVRKPQHKTKERKVSNNISTSSGSASDKGENKSPVANKLPSISCQHEDDMYELDLAVNLLRSTIKNVKGIMTKMGGNPGFQFQIEKELTSPNIRCIKQLYASANGEELLNAICSNATNALPRILDRMKMKVGEVEIERYMLHHKLSPIIFAERNLTNTFMNI